MSNSTPATEKKRAAKYRNDLLLKQIEVLEKRIEEQRQDHISATASLLEHVRKMEASFSWRLTRPLRSLRTFLLVLRRRLF